MKLVTWLQIGREENSASHGRFQTLHHPSLHVQTLADVPEMIDSPLTLKKKALANCFPLKM